MSAPDVSKRVLFLHKRLEYFGEARIPDRGIRVHICLDGTPHRVLQVLPSPIPRSKMNLLNVYTTGGTGYQVSDSPSQPGHKNAL